MCPRKELFLRLRFFFKQCQSRRYYPPPPPPSTSLPPLRVERDNARVNCCLGSFHSFIDKAERPLKIVLRILCFFCLFF